MTQAPLLVGIALAAAVGAFAARAGFDRDRAFYPMVLVVVGSYYALFAAQASAPLALAGETAGFLLFAAAAVLGFRHSLWIAAAGLAAHGLFDAVHGHLLANPGTPAWWPPFCAAYDLTAAAWLAWRLTRGAKPGADIQPAPGTS